jgi:hypothetical protein
MYKEVTLANECLILLFDFLPLSVTLIFDTDTWILYASLWRYLYRAILKSLHACRSYLSDRGFALNPNCDFGLWPLSDEPVFFIQHSTYYDEYLYQIIL